MSEVTVQRYDLIGMYDLEIGEIIDGDYVLYSDYKKLHKQIEAMKNCWNCNGKFCNGKSKGNNDVCDGWALYEQLLNEVKRKVTTGDSAND